MPKFARKIVVMFALLISTTAVAHSVKLDLSDPSRLALDSIVELPIQKLRAVEANGEILFMSESGRFVLKGQLYDLWYKDTVDTMRQMEDTATKIHFDRMGANLDEFNTLSIGSGAKQVAAFVDPQCGICHKLMQEADDFKDEYTFKFIVVPALGNESDILARKFYCAKDKAKASAAYLTNDLHGLAQRSNCDTSKYDMTLMMAHMLGVRGVPFVVAPDGRYSHGSPRDLGRWLEMQ